MQFTEGSSQSFSDWDMLVALTESFFHRYSIVEIILRVSNETSKNFKNNSIKKFCQEVVIDHSKITSVPIYSFC